jgi:very-short-patch-repair endonuclease
MDTEVQGVGRPTFLQRLTTKETGEFNCVDVLNALDERVQDYALDWTAQRLCNIEMSIYSTESPIEQLLAMALARQSDVQGIIHRADNDNFMINPQHEIEIGDKRYRVDFLVSIIMDRKQREIVIECDGHEFHERSKFQATKDKQRDRLLQSAGYRVFRYTGSEIWKDPDKCAREVFKVLLSPR